MMNTPDTRFGDRQVLTGLCLIGFALPLLVSDVLDPTRGNLGDARLDLADAAAHPSRLLASTVLVLFSTLALVLATGGIWRFARPRYRRLADIGAALTVFGALGHAALVTFNGFLIEMGTGDRDEMAALLDRLNTGTVLLLVFPLLLCLVVGLLLLTTALWRARVAPLWCLVTQLVIFVLDFSGPQVLGLTFIVYGLLVVTFGWLAVIVLGMPAREWDGASPRTAHQAPAEQPA